LPLHIATKGWANLDDFGSAFACALVTHHRDEADIMVWGFSMMEAQKIKRGARPISGTPILVPPFNKLN
jgi:hypothetical protein